VHVSVFTMLISEHRAPALRATNRAMTEINRVIGSDPRQVLLGRAGPYPDFVSEPVTRVTAEESPSWEEVVRHAEHGDTVAVVAHGRHVADVVPSGELDRLRETIDVLSDTDLVRDLVEGLADARSGRVFSASDVAADLSARRAAGE
jgi:antitoxin (DNA-binding transcriptional repressor) of toxin-antitoxin stability system